MSTEAMAPEETPDSPAVPAADAPQPGLTALASKGQFVAVAALREAAGKGDAEAMHQLANQAFAGTGVAQSYEQAIYWYCRSALGGNLDAVDCLQTIDLGSWSRRRNIQGWELACKDCRSSH